MSQGFDIVPLFATPVVLSDLPDAPTLCAELPPGVEPGYDRMSFAC